MPKITHATTLNDRFDKKAWQRYYPAVRRWISTYPQKVVIDAQNFSVETIAARLRDAVRGYYTYRWEPNDIPMQELEQIWADTQIIKDANCVILASRSHAEKTVEVVEPVSDTIRISNPTEKEVVAVLILTNNERLENRRVDLTECSPDLIPFLLNKEIETTFPNVIIERPNPNHFRLL